MDCLWNLLLGLVFSLVQCILSKDINHDQFKSQKRILADGNSVLELHMKRAFTRNYTDRKLLGINQESQLHFEPDGVYWTQLNIGTENPQTFSVIVDTGSSSIAVPCSGCEACGKHAQFTFTNESVVTNEAYSQCYSEGSCNYGKIVNAPMCLGIDCDVKSEGIVHSFGCCTTFASAFEQQDADGVLLECLGFQTHIYLI